MDFNNLTAKVKVFQRRTTQKVLQQMGMADKTEDDSPAFQNFLALGSFASQIKSTTQATNACLEKACTAQTHLASQVQSYLHSELSGDGEMPPGELNDFFSGPSDAHGAILESIAAKFCDASTEIGHNALIQIIGQLDELVLRPIQKDEEFGVVTKELIEEKKRATLDFDSYRRMAQSATSASEHEKAETKARAAKERYEDSARRVAEHINHRNQIRCKLLVHGILTAIEQYCNFYAHAVDILRDTANSLKPLMDVYQMNEAQLQSTVNLGNQPQQQQQQQSQQQQSRSRSPQQQGGKVTADSLFTDYESQNRERGGKPSAPGTRGTGALSPQLDNMMRDNLNLKKPAAAPQQAPMKNVPMNQLNNANVGTRTPPPTHHNNNINTNNNTNNVNSPHLSHNSPTHAPPQQPAPAPQPFVDLFDLSSNSSQQSQPPKEEVLVNLMDHSTPAKQTGGIFDGDLFGSGAFSAPSMPSTPAMQPSNVDIFDQTFKNVNSSGQKVSSLDREFDFLSPQPQAKNNSNTNQKPQSQQQPQQTQQTRPPPSQQQQQQQPGDLFGFDFGGPAKPQQASGGFTAPAPVPAANDQEKRGELNPAVTQKISNWAERGGRKANLRALLSTLHEVIWVDSGWDAMSLGELITPDQVKKAYRRANLIVHPDKVRNGTVEQQLMAQRIFEALRVSHETFKDEPK